MISSDSVSEVYFAGIEPKRKSWLEKLEELANKLELSQIIEKDSIVAIKVHFGERGNTAFLPPIYTRKIVEIVKNLGGKPFLTDTNTLYLGGRFNAVDHLITAYSHGFSFGTVGAPIIIGDGLSGLDYRLVKINGKHFKEAKIGSTLFFADVLIVITHFKGHGNTGFGGAIKNISMGLAARGGKQEMHSDLKPTIQEDLCNACGRCVRYCPAQAIAIEPDLQMAKIDLNKCWGCGECRAACLKGAVSINWETDGKILQEKMVEYALAVKKEKGGKIAYFNFLLNITPDCDCWEYSDPSIVPDIGIAASYDCLALDQVSLDLVNKASLIYGIEKAENKNKFELINREPGTHLLKYAEELGLGTRKYKLIKIGG